MSPEPEPNEGAARRYDEVAASYEGDPGISPKLAKAVARVSRNTAASLRGAGRPATLQDRRLLPAMSVEGHQRAKLERIAQREGVSLAEVVRRAIDALPEE